MKNPLGKSRTADDAWAEFADTKTGMDFNWRILKTYQLPKNEAANQYARWFVSATSVMMQGGGREMGDTYVSDILPFGTLVKCTPEFAEVYADHPVVGPQIETLREQGKL